MAGQYRYDYAQLRRRAQAWLETADPREMTLLALSRDLGVPRAALQRIVGGDWRGRRRAELERRVIVGLAAVAGQEFDSVTEAIAAVGAGGPMTRGHVLALSGDLGSQVRSLTGPARKARLMTTMQRLVAEGVAREEFTIERIESESGAGFGTRDDDLRREHRRLKGVLRPAVIKPDHTVIRLERQTIRRAALRSDIADLAWELLQSEHARGDQTDGHLRTRHASLVAAGEVLGSDVPEIRRVTLPQLQQAWYGAGLGVARWNLARSGLLLLLDLLLATSIEHEQGDPLEMARCAEWLAAMGKANQRPATKSLTAAESELLVERCLVAVTRGRARLAADPDVLAASTNRGSLDNAEAIVDWGSALALLVGRFTGLRPMSIQMLRADELAPIGHETYGVIWRHTKKANPEERLAIVPAPLARLLFEYEAAVRPVRIALGSDRLFVGAGLHGLWSVDFRLSASLANFARRHLAELGPVTLALLRRTFATRSLAEGRSLAAVSAQLGHSHISTTLGYTKFERSVHAVEARPALDRYGRVVLERWQRPVLLSEIDPSERVELVADRERRDCEVGLCRPGSCVMLSAGAPPPCLACQHLVTGPEYFPAWEHELEARQARIDRLSDAGGGMLTVAASEAAQLAEIERIYAELRARS